MRKVYIIAHSAFVISKVKNGGEAIILPSMESGARRENPGSEDDLRQAVTSIPRGNLNTPPPPSPFPQKHTAPSANVNGYRKRISTRWAAVTVLRWSGFSARWQSLKAFETLVHPLFAIFKHGLRDQKWFYSKTRKLNPTFSIHTSLLANGAVTIAMPGGKKGKGRA